MVACMWSGIVSITFFASAQLPFLTASQVPDLERGTNWVSDVSVDASDANAPDASSPSWDNVGTTSGDGDNPSAGRTSICAMAKNEGRYLKEWLDFHLCVGFDHFYILNDHSTDETGNILSKYQQAGLVTLINRDALPLERPQKAFNAKCMETSKNNDDKWTAFIDLDEFLYSAKGENVKATLNGFDQHSLVNVPWTTFGTSGFEQPSDEYVTQTHTLRNHHPDRIYKSIVKPNKVTSDFGSALNKQWQNEAGKQLFLQGELVHSFKVEGTRAMEDGTELNEDECCYFTPSRIEPQNVNLQLNHYRFKSQQEAEEKLSRSNANSKGNGMSKILRKAGNKSWQDWDLNNKYDDSAFALYGKCMKARARDATPAPALAVQDKERHPVQARTKFSKKHKSKTQKPKQDADDYESSLERGEGMDETLRQYLEDQEWLEEVFDQHY